MLSDAFCVVLSLWMAISLRKGEFLGFLEIPLTVALGSTILFLAIFTFNGMYRVVFRYFTFDGLWDISKNVVIFSLIYTPLVITFGIPEVPRTVGIIHPVILTFLLVYVRRIPNHLHPRAFDALKRKISKSELRPRVLVYGAGKAGRSIVPVMDGVYGHQVIGYLDDEIALHNRYLDGLLVFPPAQLGDIVKKYRVTDLILAIPSLKSLRRRQLLSELSNFGLRIRTIPDLFELRSGEVSHADVRDVDISDLIGREWVCPNRNLLKDGLAGKRVLVSGAGGSIGSELCRQVLENNPSLLILLDHSEYALYKIKEELELKFPKSAGIFIAVLVSIQELDLLNAIFEKYRPDIVYHAAAYKHVNLVELNILASIKNNVFGTKNILTAAVDHDVSTFVMVSTDKAVRPTNVMGVTKRVAELIVQAKGGGGRAQTKFSVVRFGNVVGSSGSVIPKFRQQIRDGGPVTVTHKDVVRYFMSIQEAAQLVVQAGAMGENGEVFVLDMGREVRIDDLAKEIIRLSGKSIRNARCPDGDIEVVYTGLRPGEKLYEELFIVEDRKATCHPKILQAVDPSVPWPRLRGLLSELELSVSAGNIEESVGILTRIVPEFHRKS